MATSGKISGQNQDNIKKTSGQPQDNKKKTAGQYQDNIKTTSRQHSKKSGQRQGTYIRAASWQHMDNNKTASE
jgi:hypothetical protein